MALEIGPKSETANATTVEVALIDTTVPHITVETIKIKIRIEMETGADTAPKSGLARETAIATIIRSALAVMTLGTDTDTASRAKRTLYHLPMALLRLR
jgi:hypothetical protein